MAYDERQSAVAFAGDPVHVFQECVSQLESQELIPPGSAHGQPKALSLSAGPNSSVRRTCLESYSAVSAVRRSNCALSATMIVLTDISNAPTAGEIRMFHGASTPAASGSATTL